jgi:uncharacterized protein (TIGR02284 family)
MNVRSARSRHHDEALLGEAKRGERVAMHTYQEAMDGMLPPTVRDLIERQHGAIRKTYEHLTALNRLAA